MSALTCGCDSKAGWVCAYHADAPGAQWKDEEADVNDPNKWFTPDGRYHGPIHYMTDAELEANTVKWKRSRGLSPSDLLDRCKQIAQAKSHDYTTAGDLNGPGRFENFDRAELLASWFRSDVDKPYVVLIGVKLARLAALLSAKEPQNESIEDTFVDLTNYCALWGSRRSQR